MRRFLPVFFSVKLLFVMLTPHIRHLWNSLMKMSHTFKIERAKMQITPYTQPT